MHRSRINELTAKLDLIKGAPEFIERPLVYLGWVSEGGQKTCWGLFNLVRGRVLLLKQKGGIVVLTDVWGVVYNCLGTRNEG